MHTCGITGYNMLEFLWNIPVYLFELALNVIFWGSIIAVLVWIFKEGVIRYWEEWTLSRKKEKEESPEDYIV